MSIAIGVGDLALTLRDEDLGPQEVEDARAVWRQLNGFLAARGLGHSIDHRTATRY